MKMKTLDILMIATIALATPVISNAQVAGSTLLGESYAELRDVTYGWSAKWQILGQPVFNDRNERVGSIDDVIVTSDKAVSYAIVNAGAYIGIGKHDVAIPVSHFTMMGKKLVLAGATKDALKSYPAFEYAQNQTDWSK
jgi:hypothetical protein